MIAFRAVWATIGLLMGISLARGLGAMPALPLWLAFAAAIVGSVILVRRERRWQESPAWYAAILCLAAALPLGALRTELELAPPADDSVEAMLLKADNRGSAVFRGTVCAEPQLRSRGRSELTVRLSHVRMGDSPVWQPVHGDKIMIRVAVGSDGTSEDLHALFEAETYGDQIEAAAGIRAPRIPLNPGSFDEVDYLRRQGLSALVYSRVNQVKILERRPGNPLVNLALAAKTHFLTTYRETISSPASRLVAAATLGTRYAVEDTDFRGHNIRDMFRHAGVGHVLAVSGLHVSVVALLLYSLFRMSGLRPRVFTPVLVLLLVLFALLTGARPSSVRAVIMNSVILTTHAYARMNLRHATVLGLSVSAFAILLVQPLVLFAASFLLSYGAVLSLIAVTPAVDRWIRQCRGAAALFAGMWFIACILLVSFRTDWLTRPGNVAALLGALWLALRVGNRVNVRHPRLWHWGLDRLPVMLRLFIAAQLAIQLGMMIPMSAWFFGRFPVAGIFVNLLAIPAIGVLVQLGILTGLLGLIPVAGTWLAAPLGAAVTVVAHAFYELAHIAVTVFPLPVVPRPTPAQVALYYGILIVVLTADRYRGRLVALLYRLRNDSSPARTLRIGTTAILLILLAGPLIARLIPERCREVLCLAGGRHPLVTAVTSRRRSIAVNGGDSFYGSRALFDGLRSQGVARLDIAILPGPQPQAGLEGLTKLVEDYPVGRCALVVYTEDPADYISEIGDPFLTKQAQARASWATRYERAYDRFLKAMELAGTDVSAVKTGPVVEAGNLHLQLLPTPDVLPSFGATAARTAPVVLDFGPFRWIILSDAQPDVLRAGNLKSAGPCDVLVLPDFSSRKSFDDMLNAAVQVTEPRVVVMSGSRAGSFPIRAWAQNLGGFKLFTTARDGAIHATQRGERRMRLRGHVSGLTVDLDK